VAVSGFSSGLASSYSGLMLNQAALAQSASQIADPVMLSGRGEERPELNTSLLEHARAVTQAHALYKLLQTEEEMLGRWIDTWA